jgi:hypothetical protein
MPGLIEKADMPGGTTPLGALYERSNNPTICTSGRQAAWWGLDGIW